MKLLMTAVGALLALTACGSVAGVVGPAPSSAPTSAPTPANSGYLADSAKMGGDGSWAIFWDGAATTLYQAQRNGNQIGTLNGRAVRQGSSFQTLVQYGGQGHTSSLLGSATFAVTDKDNGFELAVPWSNGTVHAYDFRPGSLTDYNADAAKMQQQAQADAAAAQQAQQQAAQAQEQQKQAQQQQTQEQAQQLQAKEAASCASIGGHVTGASHPTTALCLPNNQGPSEKPGNNCSINPTVGFNPGGTLDQGSLNDARRNYPGCFS